MTAGRALRVLIVDDDRVNRRILEHSLRVAGYMTSTATDGQGGLVAVREQQPDIVLLDVEMPGMDGYAVCAALRADPTAMELPVIFITGKSGPKDVARAFAVGASDCVSKPFRMDEVKARLSVHLQLQRAKRELRESHLQLLSAQKLEAVGRLASGIAHEINTPVQFIGDNVRFLRGAFADLDRVVTAAKAVIEAVDEGQRTLAVDTLTGLKGIVDLEFLQTECPLAIDQTLEGVDRVAKIVHAMKDFAHADQTEKAEVDVNGVIRSSVLVCRGEWKHVADLVERLDPNVPTVLGCAQELGQVIINLVVNAAHAIGEKTGGQEKGTITVRSRANAAAVEIEVADSGNGIPDAARPYIFEPFFTTKPVGKGTGQGLALSRRIVTETHGGQLSFDSQPGAGTIFRITLPVRSTTPTPEPGRVP